VAKMEWLEAAHKKTDFHPALIFAGPFGPI
jgi:hypothetical protein